tara:strand:+ start:2676 stop:2879 length:204 start_codon:yes stop_codon:yes gene_type:complete
MSGNTDDRLERMYFTRTQASIFTGVPPSTMDDYRRRGDLACTRIGRKVIYDRKTLIEWMASHAEVAG